MILVITTTSSFEDARNIAKELITNKYAACVNIIPSITSIYIWNNEIQEENEYMLFIKTAKSFEDIKNFLKKIHSYELPEIIKINLEGSEEYANWVKRFSL